MQRLVLAVVEIQALDIDDRLRVGHVVQIMLNGPDPRLVFASISHRFAVLASTRPVMLTINTATAISSAPDQARRRQSS